MREITNRLNRSTKAYRFYFVLEKSKNDGHGKSPHQVCDAQQKSISHEWEEKKRVKKGPEVFQAHPILTESLPGIIVLKRDCNTKHGRVVECKIPNDSGQYKGKQ